MAKAHKVHIKIKQKKAKRPTGSSLAPVSNNLLVAQLHRVTKEEQMETHGFLCMGTAIEVLGVLDEDPEVYVWAKSNGTMVTMYDEGNGKCSFVAMVREGNAESKAYVNVRPKDLVNV